MRFKNTVFALLAIFLAFLFLAPFTYAAAEKNLLLELQGLGGRQTTALRVNAHGTVVGYGQSPDGRTHALVWKNGVSTLLPVFANSMYSVANDINDKGVIVGTDITSDGKSHAVFWQDGVEKVLGDLNGLDSSAMSINNKGQIVGTSNNHAFLWDGNIIKDLSPSSNSSGAWTITNKSTIAGFNSNHGAIFRNNEIIDTGTLGGAMSDIRGSNDKDQLVGSSSDGSHTHATLYENGTLYDLGALVDSAEVSVAHGINSKGIITGASRENGMIVPVIWENKKIKKLDLFINAQAYTIAADINDKNQIVLYQTGPSGGKSYLLQY